MWPGASGKVAAGPSPGAAAVVTALVLLYASLRAHELEWLSATWLRVTIGVIGNKDWLATPWLQVTIGVALPILTLAAALLMVSSIRYTHVVNQYVRGKRSFGYLVKLINCAGISGN